MVGLKGPHLKGEEWEMDQYVLGTGTSKGHELGPLRIGIGREEVGG